jgi:hypothetical protein
MIVNDDDNNDNEENIDNYNRGVSIFTCFCLFIVQTMLSEEKHYYKVKMIKEMKESLWY